MFYMSIFHSFKLLQYEIAAALIPYHHDQVYAGNTTSS